MIIGTAAWGFRETALGKQLETTRNMGLDLLELGIGGHENDFLQLNADSRDVFKVKKLFRQHKIKLLCASTGNDFTSENKNACIESMENVKKAIDIAESLGIEKLRVFAGFSPVNEVVDARWDTMMEMLNEIAEYGHRHGVLPAIETHGGVEEYLDGIRHFNSTTTVKEKLENIFTELEYPAGMVFDPANLGAVGMNEDEIIALYQKFLPKIAYFHLKDFAFTPGGALKPCACGEGKLDWSVLWKTLKESPYPGVIEYELPEDVDQGLKRSLRHLTLNKYKIKTKKIKEVLTD
jgi:sugar phosphate isomerase/epimerase